MKPNLLILSFTLGLPIVCSAITTNWTGSVSNDWSNPANWSAGVPGSADIANVVTLTNPPTVPGGTTVSELWAGGPGGAGNGHFNITAGTVTATGWTAIGRDSTGSATITNANLNGRLVVGSFVNGRGTLNVGTGATVTNANDFWVIGEQNGAQGRVNQTDGIMNVVGGFEAQMAASANTYGNYVMSGGALNAQTTFQIGASGVGVFKQSGGTVTHSANTWAAVGRFAGGNGELTVTGGAHNHDLAGASASHHYIIGEEGVGVVNVSVAGTLATGRDVILGGNNGNGTLNIGTGGVVMADRIRDMNGNAANGPSRVSFDGGTLRAGAGVDVADFLQGLTSVTVNAGGAIIDTNGTNVTVNQALVAPTGNGVTGISVTNGGSAYLGAPFVQITGGGGVGATAVANVDGAGVITSIAITNPGTGYTSTPTVNLLGGEPISAASLSIATGATLSGGLTKMGGGVLTLTGANTYTGTTRILRGTLALGVGGSLSASSVVEVADGASFDGSAVGGITIPSGQTLQGTGTAIGNVAVIGTLAPGNSIGTLNFTGNLSLSGTSNFEFNPSSASDLANVTGSVTYGGILNFSNLGGTPTKFDTFNLFDAASFSGSFATLNLPSYAAGDYWENNLLANGTLTYVPEPGTTALMLAFAGFGLRRRRRE